MSNNTNPGWSWQIINGETLYNYSIGYNSSGHDNFTYCCCSQNYWQNVTAPVNDSAQIRKEKNNSYCINIYWIIPLLLNTMVD